MVAVSAFQAKETVGVGVGERTGIGVGVGVGVGLGVGVGVGVGVGLGVEVGVGVDVGLGVGVGVGAGEAAARKATICITHGPALWRGAEALKEPTAVLSWSSAMSPWLVSNRWVNPLPGPVV